MTGRILFAAAAMLAAMTLSGHAAPACESGTACAAGAKAASAPLNLNSFRKKARRVVRTRPATTVRATAERDRRVARVPAAAPALASSAAEPPSAVLPPPRPDLGDRWPDNAYAMTATAEENDAEETAPPAPQVRVVDAGEVNEIDRLADAVHIVSARDFNEIDARADLVGQRASEPGPAPATASSGTPRPNAWLAALALAFGVTVAGASALRMRAKSAAG
jgi:hypothetical protein